MDFISAGVGAGLSLAIVGGLSQLIFGTNWINWSAQMALGMNGNGNGA